MNIENNSTPLNSSESVGREVDSHDLLAAFLEHEKWLEEELASMEREKNRYVTADYFGLPYARDVLKMIRKRALELHPASDDPHAAAIFELHRKRQGLG